MRTSFASSTVTIGIVVAAACGGDATGGQSPSGQPPGGTAGTLPDSGSGGSVAGHTGSGGSVAGHTGSGGSVAGHTGSGGSVAGHTGTGGLAAAAGVGGVNSGAGAIGGLGGSPVTQCCQNGCSESCGPALLRGCGADCTQECRCDGAGWAPISCGVGGGFSCSDAAAAGQAGAGGAGGGLDASAE